MSAQESRRSGVLGAILGMLGFSGLAGLLVAIMVTPAIAVTGMTANNAVGIFNELPEYATLGDDLAQKVTLYGTQGGQPVPFATIFETNREEVGWDEISQYAKDAAVYGEDARFFEHGGVDMQSIMRALASNVRSGEVESGGSTITMQVIRNINIEAANQLEDPEARKAAYTEAVEPSMDRKLKEMKLAIGLEKRYDKQTILLAYLNIANFGGTTYGIQAAAQRYFGVNATDLTPAQAASLIAIVQYPASRSLESPDNYERNKIRRDYILGQMLKYKSIDQAQYDEAIATPIEPTLTPLNNGCMAASIAPYFCDYVVKTLLNDPAFGETADDRRQAFRKGYDVYTTLDIGAQATAEATMRQWVPSYDDRFQLGSSTVGVQPGTGRIIYMTQNTSFNDTAAGGGPGTSAVNYSTDYDRGGSRGFQPGSIYKIFTLGQWLKDGHGLNEVVTGKPQTWRQSTFTRCGSPMGGADWKPKNDSSSPTNTNVVNATATSNNNAFVDMAQELDICDIRDTAASLGMHTATGEKDGSDMMTVLASVIGGSDDTFAPLTIANAFASISARGLTCTPTGIDRVTTPNGEELKVPNPNCRQTLDPEIADAMIYAMKRTLMGGGTAVASRPYNSVPIFGKTGSTDAYNQTWVATATTSIAGVTWVGNVQGTQAMSRTYINGMAGSRLRHAVQRQLNTQWQTFWGGNDWPEPNRSFLTGNNAPVPDLTGQSVDSARELIESLGFNFEDGGPIASSLDAGLIAQTDPGAGASVPRGTTITVYTSDGSLKATMPDVVGQQTDEALNTLIAEGFSASRVSYSFVEGPPGQVCRVKSSDPAAGAGTTKDAAITLTVISDADGEDPGCP
ncbi:transglycosylase domain-containing protein [Ruicaihuangia caeni]|uniref:Transglycosylase domain-containing protein n=1 Tax=Ruicaihuangia caeni TaxID=3042517 RepID=A0AAW6TCZ3_9MICO|nr:transglycosylase domain-containing protein [Klugiella sp. YN-L-19]MDI2099255.1 transglycosylase domain-containing protein [Klugiella sp. YN-L-19]